jgi:hypothetical protein
MPILNEKDISGLRATEISFVTDLESLLQGFLKEHETSEILSVMNDGEMTADERESELEYLHYRSETISQIVRRSFAMTVCTVIENQLGDLCAFLRKKYEERISLENFRNRGRGLKARCDYIYSVSQRRFLENNREFQNLINIRNPLAHEDGVVLKKGFQLNNSKLATLKYGRIYIEKDNLKYYALLLADVAVEIDIFRLGEVGKYTRRIHDDLLSTIQNDAP